MSHFSNVLIAALRIRKEFVEAAVASFNKKIAIFLFTSMNSSDATP
ncbi:hypothetical protein GOL22_31965 [Sinorhizobium medicae]|nr:hypothetical protein [Sinorhizobium medicae]